AQNDFMHLLNRVSEQYNLGVTVKLPTEAQWEYAVRAESEGPFYFPAEEMQEHAWYGERWETTGHTHPVGLTLPNAWGLCDMSGNAWEWCQDWYEQNYGLTEERLREGVTDPLNDQPGFDHVLRGGGWRSYARYLRSAYRSRARPFYRYGDIGFRLLIEDNP
ncbi:MAG: formylglycine-generating enzyme family protein, partial [Bacteroidetes bacterium]|nr:formylglycine-generating enzyme family protein [Bacteroidota bacterium]